MLDTAAEPVELLAKSQTSHGLAYFLTRSVGTKHVKIIEAGSTERVMTAPDHPYTRALMAAAFDLAAAPA